MMFYSRAARNRKRLSLLACDNNTATLLMLLDLSATFDTVDPNKMLLLLEKKVWFVWNCFEMVCIFSEGKIAKIYSEK